MLTSISKRKVILISIQLKLCFPSLLSPVALSTFFLLFYSPLLFLPQPLLITLNVSSVNLCLPKLLHTFILYTITPFAFFYVINAYNLSSREKRERDGNRRTRRGKKIEKEREREIYNIIEKGGDYFVPIHKDEICFIV